MGLLDPERLLLRTKPGAALTLLARTGVPIFGPDRFAGAEPEPDIDLPDASPLCEECDPFVPAGASQLLDGDVVIKDQIDVRGTSTGVGLADRGEPVDKDAAVVTRIREAGGRIIGKAKMTELGIDGLGPLMHYPMPANPVAPGYCPGGSSTGTAVAVATGLARYGVGGDGLGSIRIPAAFCGLVGLRPSRTRYPREGIRAPVKTLDSIGPITRTVEDCARLWQVIAGEPITDVVAWAPDRVGVPIMNGPLRVSRSIWRAFRRALDAIGTALEPIEIAGFEHVTFLGGLTGAYESANGPFAGRTTTKAGRTSLALGQSLSARDFERLTDQRQRLAEATQRAFDRTPILAMPTTAIPPPALTRTMLAGSSSLIMLRALGAFTPLANLLDLPSIAVPCGVDDRGRPLSIMFVANHGGEHTLLQIARSVEATGLGTELI